MFDKRVKREGVDEWITYTLGDQRFEAVCLNKTCIKDQSIVYIYLNRERIAEFTINAPSEYFTRAVVRCAIRGMIDQLVLNLRQTKRGEAK